MGTGVKTVNGLSRRARVSAHVLGLPYTFGYKPVAGHEFEGQEAGLFDKVKARFKDYLQVNLVKGLLPDSFAPWHAESIAYLHIDLNNAEGELAVLKCVGISLATDAQSWENVKE